MSEEREQLTWGIQGGRTGDADSLFLKNKVIALGWIKMEGSIKSLSLNFTTTCKKYRFGPYKFSGADI